MSMVKTIIRKILYGLAWTTSFALPVELVSVFKLVAVRFFSFWLSRRFKQFGNNSIIGYPIYLRGHEFIEIEDNVHIGSRAILTAWSSYRSQIFSPLISIGANSHIGEDAHITAINRIVIGANVLLGKKVTITDNSHGTSELADILIAPIERKLISKGGVTIEDNVWIGDKVTILSDVTIGRNSIIGANSVISKSVEPFSIVGGIPARVLKTITYEGE